MRHALRGRATRSTGLPRSDLGVAYATARRALAPPARAAVAVGSLPRPAPSALTCENGRAAGGKVYLAVVLDAWSRMVIGWSIADHIRSGLVVDALQMAIWRRRPAQGKTICHTDHRLSPVSSTRRGRSGRPPVSDPPAMRVPAGVDAVRSRLGGTLG